MSARRKLPCAALVSQRLSLHWFVGVLAAQASAPQSLISRFETAPCPFEVNGTVSAQVGCGYVTVSKIPKPDGRRLRLAVAILKSFSGTPPRSGGAACRRPGRATCGPGTQRCFPHQRRQRVDRHAGSERDVILYDQRGVGFSEPAFCPDEAANWRGQVGPPRTALRRQVAARCGDAMRRFGFHLSQ
jgi:hypothetical protein